MIRLALASSLIVTLLLATLRPPTVSAGEIELPADLSFLRQSQLVIPQADAVFEADGRIHDAERAAAAQVQRFVTFEREAIGDNRVTLHLAHTGDELYVGFEVALPPGHELRTTANRRGDPGLWGRDDSLEMRFIVGDRIYCFIGNAAGVRGEMRYDTGDMSWETEHWSYNARQTETGWEGEFLIGAAAFELERFETGMAWRADIFNNLKSGRQSGWAYQGGRWNTHRETWPRIVFGDHDAVYLDRQRLGTIGQRDIGLESQLVNAGQSAREVDLWARVFRVMDAEEGFSYFEAMEGMFDTTGVDILPGADQAERLAWMMERSLLPRMARGDGVAETRRIGPGETERIDLRRPSYPGTYLAAWRYADAATGQVIGSGVFPFSSTPPLTTEVEYHYLTAEEVELRTDVPELPGLDAVRYTVFDEQGERVGRKQADDAAPGMPLTAVLSAADWPFGELALQVEALDAQGQALASHQTKLQRPEPPSWWQSDAGKLIEVSHGWTPVEARERQARVWGRAYRWDEGPLPASIESQGEQLLASAMRLVTSLDGDGEVAWRQQRRELIEASDGKAVYRSDHQAGDLRLTMETTVEFDGLVRFDLELAPGSDVPTVDQLFLEIPVRREHAQMFARARYMGLVPGPEQPSDWAGQYPESGLIGDEAIDYRFVPWVTLRSEDLGLEWFAEQDWHWSNADEGLKLQIVPEDDRVVLRVRLIDQPTRIADARPITFGIQAWPVKAWPDRDPNVSNYLGVYNVPEDSVFQRGMGGTPEEIRENIAEAIDHEMDVMWIFHWSGAWGPEGSRVVSIPDYPQLHHVNYPQYHEDMLERVSTYARITQELGIPVIGHAGYAMPTYVPDFQIWGMEMLRRPLDHKGIYGFKDCANSPHVDGFVTRLKELAEQTGWSGLQLDGALMPEFCQSERHGCGMRDADGRLHGSYPIFAFRDKSRRIYNVLHGEVEFPGIERGFLYNHGGSSPPGPVYAFSDAIHGGEDRASMNAHSLAEFDLDEQRALYPVGSFGVPRDLLLKFGKAPVGPRGRIAWAVQVNMNVSHNRILRWLPRNDYQKGSAPVDRLWKARRWIDASPSNFHGYWENQAYVNVSPDDFYAGFHFQRGERMLLAVTNWHPEPRRATIELNLARLGFADHELVAQDAVTGENVDMNNGRLELDVTEDGYRLVKIWAR